MPSSSSSSSSETDSVSTSVSNESFHEEPPKKKAEEPKPKKEVEMVTLKNDPPPAENEEIIFEGTVGLCGMYHYRISNLTIQSTEVRGFLFVILMTIVGAVLGFAGGLIGEMGQAGPNEDLRWEIPGSSAGGGLVVFLFVGILTGMKKKKDTLEVKNVADVSLEQTCLQNCRNKQKATLVFLSPDPTTPSLKCKLPDAYTVFDKMILVLDNLRERDLDTQVDEKDIYDGGYGRRCCVCCGCWGCCPQRHYHVTNKNISAEEACCCKKTKNNIRMSRVYDLQLVQNCLQFCAPKCFPCCTFCPMFHKANINVFSFDKGDSVFKMKVAKGDDVFDAMSPLVNSNVAAEKFFADNKLSLQIQNQFSVPVV